MGFRRPDLGSALSLEIQDGTRKNDGIVAVNYIVPIYRSYNLPNFPFNKPFKGVIVSAPSLKTPFGETK